MKEKKNGEELVEWAAAAWGLLGISQWIMKKQLCITCYVYIYISVCVCLYIYVCVCVSMYYNYYYPPSSFFSVLDVVIISTHEFYIFGFFPPWFSSPFHLFMVMVDKRLCGAYLHLSTCHLKPECSYIENFFFFLNKSINTKICRQGYENKLAYVFT